MIPEFESEIFQWKPITQIQIGECFLINKFSSLVQAYKVLGVPDQGQTSLQVLDQWDFVRKYKIFNNNTQVLALKQPFVRRVPASTVNLDQSLITKNRVAKVARIDRLLDGKFMSLTFTLNDLDSGWKLDTLNVSQDDYVELLIPARDIPDKLIPATEIQEGHQICLPFEDKRLWDKRHRGGRQWRGFLVGDVVSVSQPTGRFKRCIRVVKLDDGTKLHTLWLFGDTLVELLGNAALPPLRPLEAPGHLKVELWL